MSSRNDFVNKADASAVVEMAVEPSYISEIARKLQAADVTYNSMGFNRVIRMVSRAVFALERDNRVETTNPDYGTFGGQKKSSPHTSIAGEGFAERGEWKEYTIVKATKTEYGAVRPSFKEFVDPSITFEEKVDIADHISRVGNQMARMSEEILQDLAVGMFPDADVMETSGYNDPGVDLYIQGFEAPDRRQIEHGVCVEITTRYVNPIGNPYVSSKLNHVMDKESEHGVAVDLIILAPVFTRGMTDKYEDSDIVKLRRVPQFAQGNPIITQDDPEQYEAILESNRAGPDYPVVLGGYQTFQEDLAGVLRDYEVMTESVYRYHVANELSQAL